MSEFTTVSLAGEVLDEVLNNNRDVIQEQFIQRLTPFIERDDLKCTQDVSKLIGYASAIAINISVELAAAVSVTMLEKAGLIKPVEKPVLSLVWDSSKHQHEDNQ